MRAGLGVWGDFLKKVVTHEKEKPGAGGHLKRRRAENIGAAILGSQIPRKRLPLPGKGVCGGRGVEGPGSRLPPTANKLSALDKT